MEISPSSFRPTWAEIDLDAIIHNIMEFRRILAPDVKIMAVLKADAYGHGAIEVAAAAEKGGVDFFAVAFWEEGVELRLAGIKKPILLMGTTPPQQVPKVLDYDLTQTIFSLETAAAISKEAVSRQMEVPVHVKVDTGMGRVGVSPEEALSFVQEISRLPGICVEGIMTHFASADDEDLSYTYGQIESFQQTVKACKEADLEIPLIHAANSAGTINVPASHYNLVRLGLSLYGHYPPGNIEVANKKLEYTPSGDRQTHSSMLGEVSLQPAFSFKTRVVYLKDIPPGACVSYGSTFQAQRQSTIATVPVGYADGFNRLLSNRGQVLVRGCRAPIVGRVCMDYSMVDVTGIDGVEVGDEVVLYGRQEGEEISVDEVAGLLDTISYELLCAVDKRVSRFYLQGGKVVAFRNLLGKNCITSDGAQISASLDY